MGACHQLGYPVQFSVFWTSLPLSLKGLAVCTAATQRLEEQGYHILPANTQGCILYKLHITGLLGYLGRHKQDGCFSQKP